MKKLTSILLILLFVPGLMFSAVADNIEDKLALADKYRKELKYDEAYKIYKELSDEHPENTTYLTSSAEMLVLMGRESDAFSVYEKALSMDPDNLEANVFMGNYYFLQAELKRAALEEKLKESTSPSRVQNAEYKKEMNLLYITTYSKAKTYFEKVMNIFPSSEAKRTLGKLEKIEKYLQGSRNAK